MLSPTRSKINCEPSNADVEPGTVPKTGRRKRPTVPPNQRKRAKQACEPCRHNKLKCDGQSPCGRCLQTQKQCDYPDIKTAPNRSTVPPSVGNAQKIQQYNAEKLRLLESLFAKLHPEILVDDLTALQSCDWNTKQSTQAVRPEKTRHLSGTLNTSPRPDAASDGPLDQCEGIGRTSMPTATVTVIDQGNTHFEGRFSYWTFFKSARQIVSGGIDEDDSIGAASGNSRVSETHISSDHHRERFVHHLPRVQSPPDLKTAVLAALPPRDVVDFLVATFFRRAQGNQFYIHPEIFSRKLSALYDGAHEFDLLKVSDSKRSSEFICLMFMVFAIGSQFSEVETSHREPGLGHPGGHAPSPVPARADTPALDFSRLTVPEPSQPPGWQFYEISRRLLADVIVASSMTSVQVCVLQGIFLPSAESRDASYNLLGLALRMAVNMGMHRSFGTESLHPHVRELRNRLWWSVYVAERIFSVEMGRPLAIDDAEIDAPLPMEMPDWANSPGKSPLNLDGLIAMIKLCHLLGRIVDTVYCKPTSGEGTIMSPSMFRKLQDEIEQSRKDLPARLRSTTLDSDSRSAAHVALAYEQATILLTRSCLNHAAAASHSGAPTHNAITEFVQEQAQTCVKSAVTTIRIMFSLRAQSQLCRFSFHDSLYGTAAVYVLLLGQRLEWLSSNVIREHIRQGVLILLDLAKGSKLAACALKHVLRKFQKDTSNLENSNGVIARDEETKLEKGRKAWRAWVTKSSPGNLARPAIIPSGGFASVPIVGNENYRGSLPDTRIYGSDVWKFPSFLAFEDSGFNVSARDLTAAPDIMAMGHCNFP